MSRVYHTNFPRRDPLIADRVAETHYVPDSQSSHHQMSHVKVPQYLLSSSGTGQEGQSQARPRNSGRFQLKFKGDYKKHFS